MTVITTGVKGGPLVARQELRTMMQDQDLFTLYLLGLERFQAVDESDPLSWYQIAGIHGRPYVEYDPAPGSKATPAGWPGYCTHSSILFPIWHRPYLVLFEQALAKHVTDIANEYTGDAKRRYVAAAQRFRIPYWDWAYYADPADVVTRQEEVTLNGPKGIRTLKNPLYQYTFHAKDGRRDFGSNFRIDPKWQGWPSTLRRPTSLAPNATSNGAEVDDTLHKQASNFRGNTYKLLLNVTDYGVFSNDSYPGPRTDVGSFQSIEHIHNDIHVQVGGPDGHMRDSGLASFDPIFALHHTNVDRLFAIWQALHPNSYIDTSDPQPSDGGTFTTRNGEKEGPNTPLTPFRQPEGGYWTSVGARDTRTFNYTYPELAKWASLSPGEKARRLNTDVIVLYGSPAIAKLGDGVFSNAKASVPIVSRRAPSTFAAAKMTAMAMEAPQALIAQTQATVTAPLVAQAGSASQKVMSVPDHEPPASTPAASETTPITHYNDWTANIVVEKYAAGSSFSVHFFLGEFNPDPAKWALDDNLVGTYSVFATEIATTGCANCQTAAREGKLVTGTVPLTEALAQRLGKDKIAALEPEEIIPYLTKELHWRIEASGGRAIERADMPSLKVSVSHAVASVPTSITDLPTWGESVRHAAVTTGRPGGDSEEE